MVVLIDATTISTILAATATAPAPASDTTTITTTTTANLQECASDGNARERSKGRDGVAGRVVAAILVRCAELADADGDEGYVGAGGEAEDDGVEDQQGFGGSSVAVRIGAIG